MVGQASAPPLFSLLCGLCWRDEHPVSPSPVLDGGSSAEAAQSDEDDNFVLSESDKALAPSRRPRFDTIVELLREAKA